MRRLGPEAPETMWKSTKELEEELSVQQGEKALKRREGGFLKTRRRKCLQKEDVINSVNGC